MHERKKELKQIAFAFIISLCLLVGAASANILVNFPEEQMNGSVGYTCFEVLPPWLAETFQNRMRSGDRIIGGMVRYENAGNPSEQTCSGIVALQRDSRIILYGLSQNHPGIGQVRAETDVFLSPEDDFEFLPLRVLNPDGRMTQVELGVRKGNQVLSLNVEDGKIAISQCLTLQGETGTLLSVPQGMGSLSICPVRPGGTDQGESWYGVMTEEEEWIPCPHPERLWAWENRKLPDSGTAIEAMAEQIPIYPLPENMAYVDADLFVEPNSESESIGHYTARAEVLESAGAWVKVRIGRTEGWVMEEDLYTVAGVMGQVGKVTSVAAALTDLTLLDAPGGNRLGTVSAGTEMHVLCTDNGYAHVLIPEKGVHWPTDWDGIYGYVRINEIATGESPAEAKEIASGRP